MNSLDKYEYQMLVKKVVPKHNKIRNLILSFVMGGGISFLGEFINLILKNNTCIIKEDRVVIIMFIFIGCGALLTGLGLFDNLVQLFGAGLFIPITGFANAVCSEALEYKSEGPIYGVGANMFKLAGSVITYGIFTSILLSLIYALFI